MIYLMYCTMAECIKVYKYKKKVLSAIVCQLTKSVNIAVKSKLNWTEKKIVENMSGVEEKDQKIYKEATWRLFTFLHFSASAT
jgi:biotin synthase-related radical SAM superfamily protein